MHSQIDQMKGSSKECLASDTRPPRYYILLRLVSGDSMDCSPYQYQPESQKEFLHDAHQSKVTLVRRGLSCAQFFWLVFRYTQYFLLYGPEYRMRTRLVLSTPGCILVLPSLEVFLSNALQIISKLKKSKFCQSYLICQLTLFASTRQNP